MSVPDDGANPQTDLDRAIGAIRARGATVREAQVDRALSELDDADLSTAQREAVERLGDRLVARLLAVPEARLRGLAADGDEAAVAQTLTLFGSARGREH